MAAIQGYGGKVMVNGVEVSEVKEWTINISADLLDTTKMAVGSTGWKTFIAGLRGASGTVRCNWDATGATGQGYMQTASLGATAAANLVLYVNGTQNYSIASSYIQALNPRAAVTGVTEATFNFTANGAVVYNNS